MATETRPTLQGLDDAQRTLAMAHWWLWLTVVGRIPGVGWERTGCNGNIVLTALEAAMQPETLHRLAQARDRYWKETRSGGNGSSNH